MLIDFLRTAPEGFKPDQLRAALEVLRAFKAHEDVQDWLRPNAWWIRLEQLEEFLGHLVLDESLKADTLGELKRLGRSS